MISFGQETLFEVIDEVEALLRLHYEELAKNQDRVHLSPDWDRYVGMERAGSFHIFTARNDAGALVGYSAFFALKHPHYTGLMLVSNDVLFLHPDHRGADGVRLIKHCEREIQARYGKDTSITWHAKKGTVLESLLPRLGYQVQDIVFSKLF